MKPLCIDLFCGLGGWAEGFLAEGWDVIGFDIERHDYGTGVYPGHLVLQDVLTLHGSQFRKADCIVASPPCQAYSYMAMPWDRSKREIRWQEWERESPFGNFRLNELFDACFRVQREACEAAGQYIPMVVENVRGAQKWVGRAAWHYGSYYLWGDVPTLMPTGRILNGSSKANGGFINPGEDDNPVLNSHNSRRGTASGGVLQRESAGIKMHIAGEGKIYGGGHGWDGSAMRQGNSHSPARKAASAQIAKIPFELASYIARVYKPQKAMVCGA